MANAITIDSSVIESIISNVGSDKAKIQEVKSSLDSTCAPLVACGLFEGCLNSLKEEADNISSTYDAIQTSLQSHVSDVSSLEQQIQNVGSDYRSYYSPGTGGGSSSSSSGADSGVEGVQDGKKVDPEKMETKIDALDIKSIEKMILFTLLIKNKSTSLMQLLFDPAKAEDFAKILKKFYSTYGTLEVEYDDASKVQKQFVKKILNDKTDISENLIDITILKYKKYLVKVANDNKVNPEDLMLDDKYKDMLTSSLKKLYEGDVDKSEFDDDFCDDFKAFVNMKANTKNTTPDAILGDVKSML